MRSFIWTAISDLLLLTDRSIDYASSVWELRSLREFRIRAKEIEKDLERAKAKKGASAEYIEESLRTAVRKGRGHAPFLNAWWGHLFKNQGHCQP